MLLTYHPGEPLASYVEKLWYCDGSQVVYRNKRVLPNGRFQLFISLSDAPLQGPGGTMGESGQRASSLVVGMSSRFSWLDTSKLQSAMGVMFWPGGARAFFDGEADTFHNKSVPLDSSGAHWPAKYAVNCETQAYRPRSSSCSNLRF